MNISPYEGIYIKNNKIADINSLATINNIVEHMSYLDSINDQGEAFKALKSYEKDLKDIKFEMMNDIYVYMHERFIAHGKDRKRKNISNSSKNAYDNGYQNVFTILNKLNSQSYEDIKNKFTSFSNNFEVKRESNFDEQKLKYEEHIKLIEKINGQLKYVLQDSAPANTWIHNGNQALFWQ